MTCTLQPTWILVATLMMGCTPFSQLSPGPSVGTISIMESWSLSAIDAAGRDVSEILDQLEVQVGTRAHDAGFLSASFASEKYHWGVLQVSDQYDNFWILGVQFARAPNEVGTRIQVRIRTVGRIIAGRNVPNPDISDIGELRPKIDALIAGAQSPPVS